ncbi:MAG: hypothetical protein V4687_05255 [Bacteroidota bacterium]
MKILLIILLTFLFNTGYTQALKYPLLSSETKSVKALVPPQWKLIDSVSGDLNGDHTADLALVLEFYAAIPEHRAYGDNDTELITEVQRPRILAVYFKSGKKFKLALQNNNFILRSEEGGGTGDPLLPLNIHEQNLNINFKGGSNWKWQLSYGFRFNNNEWQLATARNYTFHDASGEMNDRKYDFLSKTKTTEAGTISNKKKANTAVAKPIKLARLKTFATFKKPWTWEIDPGEFL